MAASTTLSLRREELARRVRALPDELDAWKERSVADLDMNVHFSQVQAIEILMKALTAKQQTLLGQLDPDDAAEGFRQVAFNLVVEIIKSGFPSCPSAIAA